MYREQKLSITIHFLSWRYITTAREVFSKVCECEGSIPSRVHDSLIDSIFCRIVLDFINFLSLKSLHNTWVCWHKMEFSSERISPFVFLFQDPNFIYPFLNLHFSLPTAFLLNLLNKFSLNILLITLCIP